MYITWNSYRCEKNRLIFLQCMYHIKSIWNKLNSASFPCLSLFKNMEHIKSFDLQMIKLNCFWYFILLVTIKFSLPNKQKKYPIPVAPWIYIMMKKLPVADYSHCNMMKMSVTILITIVYMLKTFWVFYQLKWNLINVLWKKEKRVFFCEEKYYNCKYNYILKRIACLSWHKTILKQTLCTE